MADLMGSLSCIYCCFKCQNQIAPHDGIISKQFRGSHGRAFLFSEAVNIKEGEKKERQMRSGVYTVSDVYCSDCGEELGWRYIKAFEETQKYKEGKFVLEIFKIVKSSA
ncbi:hypothetical protein K1719_028661 [Acacia pycnantha]|nr:hypothetical protein K1719_028661 [Acacia pycnantha]